MVDDAITDLAAWLGRDAVVVRGTAIMLAALAAGSLVRGVTCLVGPGRKEPAAVRLRRLGTWWIIAAILTSVVAVGEAGLLGLMVIVSVLGLHEYLGRVHAERTPRPVAALAYGVVAGHYALIGWGETGLALAMLPTLGMIVVLVGKVIVGRTSGYIASAGSLLLGVLLTAYLPSFVLLLLPAAGGVDPLAPAMLLIWLTLLNDISGALIGKAVGGPRILPKVSPSKTWSGTLGGIGAAVVLGAVAAPALIGGSWLAGAGAGLVIGVGGFFGDANMSAIKRDRGLDDSGRLLPGQGGMLDRLDSLGFAAALLFLYLYLL